MRMEDDNEELDVIELEDNLSEIEKPPELPPGNYVGEVQDVQKKTSGKGNAYYAVKFVIPQKNLPADIREHYEDGAVLYWNRQLVPTAKDRRSLHNLRKFIEALGLDSNTTQIDPSEWMGCSARLKIIHERYQGETRAQLRAVEKADAEGGRRTASKGKEAEDDDGADAPSARGGRTKAPPVRGRR